MELLDLAILKCEVVSERVLSQVIAEILVCPLSLLDDLGGFQPIEQMPDGDLVIVFVQYAQAMCEEFLRISKERYSIS